MMLGDTAWNVDKSHWADWKETLALQASAAQRDYCRFCTTAWTCLDIQKAELAAANLIMQ
jgi:hypothetical protein